MGLTLQGDNYSYSATVESVSSNGAAISAVTPDISGDQVTSGQPPWNSDVQVTTPAATSAINEPGNEYEFAPLAVTSVSPPNGAYTGGTSITISGFGFSGASEVDFTDSSCTSDTNVVPAYDFTVNADGTQITLDTPDETTNFQADAPTSCTNELLETDVVVDTPNGNSPVTPSDQYSFGGPTVTSLSVSSGPSAGGSALTVKGFGFGGATEVSFQDAGCTSDSGTVSVSLDADAVHGQPGRHADQHDHARRHG